MTDRSCMKLALFCSFVALAGCGGGGADESGNGSAVVTIEGEDYSVGDVSVELVFDEDPWYRIEGTPSGNEDCVPGLSAGMFLYGSLPASAHEAKDLVGERLPLEFSGDGDDANLCFVGMDGLAGAEDAWVEIANVVGDRIEFRMSGQFQLYDEEGNASPLTASARGTAQIASGS